MKKVNCLKLLFLFFLVITLSGCLGYRFAGSGVMPQNIESVYMPIFQNKTNESSASIIVTNAFVYEFNKKSIRIVKERKKADGVFKGVVQNIAIDDVSRTESISMGKKLIVTIRCILIKNDETIWDKEITDYEVYTNSDDIATVEQNKKEALIKVSEKMAEAIYNDMTSNF